MFGWTAGDMVGQPYPLLQPAQVKNFLRSATRRSPKGLVRIAECRRVRKDGSFLDVRASAGVVRDALGQVTGLLAIAEDVTDRKSVEAERDHWFHESQQLLTVCETDGTIRRVNDTWRRLLRHSPEDLVGRQLIDLVHPGDRANLSPPPEPRARRHDPFESRCVSADGEYRWFLWRSTAIKDEGFYAFGTDITDRKAFEQELWDAHAETERLLASISSILIRIDQQGRITRWNSAAQETFGIDSLAAVGRRFTECAQWSDQGRAEEVISPRDEPYRAEDLRFTGLDGRDHFVTLTVTPLLRGNGNDGFLVLGADVTEHKILEGQLRQAQKLEAIGQLASGIAHEINTRRNTSATTPGSSKTPSAISAACSTASRDCAGGRRRPDNRSAGARGAGAGGRPRRHRVPPDRNSTRRLTVARRRQSRLAHRPGHEGLSHPSEAKVTVDLNRAMETTMIVAQNELKYVANTNEPRSPTSACRACRAK